MERWRGNRRDFLKTATAAVASTFAAATLDGVASHVVGKQTLLTPLWELLETGSLLRPKAVSEAEKTYGIAIFDPVDPVAISDKRLIDRFGLVAVTAIDQYNHAAELISFDRPRLSALTEVLAQLPANFFTSPSGVVSFLLLNSFNLSRRELNEENSFRALCACDPDKIIWSHLVNNYVDSSKPPVVAFVKKDLRVLYPYDRQIARRLIVHELTHLKTMAMVNREGERNLTIDQLFTCLDLPLPTNYGSADPNLVRLFKKHLNAQGQPVESDLLGLSVIPLELVAIAAESYFEGKEVFSHTYQDCLGQAAVVKLYDCLHDNVFEGREYQAGKWLN